MSRIMKDWAIGQAIDRKPMVDIIASSFEMPNYLDEVNNWTIVDSNLTRLISDLEKINGLEKIRFADGPHGTEELEIQGTRDSEVYDEISSIVVDYMLRSKKFLSYTYTRIAKN